MDRDEYYFLLGRTDLTFGKLMTGWCPINIRFLMSSLNIPSKCENLHLIG